MFGGFGITELLVVLAIVLLLFGTKKLRTIGSDLGSAIKGFRKAMTADDEPKLMADEPKELSSDTAKPKDQESTEQK